jgi:phosphate transport system permease protein
VSAVPASQTQFRDWLKQTGGGSNARLLDGVMERLLQACAGFSILITLGIVIVIFQGSFLFFATHDQQWMSLSEVFDRLFYFFTGTKWTESSQRYGVLPLVTATGFITVIAAAVSLPIGLMTAIYLSEYATPRVRSIAKPVLELLAGIPTVVYGFFAIEVLTPYLAKIVYGLQQPNNLLSAGIVVGIMIIPMVASLSEDALRAVPRALRDGSYALGANKFETSTLVVVPAALSGITASFILAISRAVGETMAVTLAAGETARLTFDPREGAATMTAFIVHRAKGEVPHFSTEFNSLFAVAGVLFLTTLTLNIIAQQVLRRYRQVYQ